LSSEALAFASAKVNERVGCHSARSYFTREACLAACPKKGAVTLRFINNREKITRFPKGSEPCAGRQFGNEVELSQVDQASKSLFVSQVLPMNRMQRDRSLSLLYVSADERLEMRAGFRGLAVDFR
jgi:hypothetical protein